MGKINGCLKCLFIFFNVVFAIIGCVLLYLAAQSSLYSLQMSQFGGPNPVWSWVFAISVLGISSLGIYAGCSEKDLALKAFAGFMGCGMVIMLIFGIIVAVAKNEIKSIFEQKSTITKLLMGDQESKALMEILQQSARCCGVMSASDWGDTIPQSCACFQFNYGDFGECKTKPMGARGPDRIYSQNCSPIILTLVDYLFQITMGILFGFAAIALLGLLVSLLMLYQVRRYDGVGPTSIAMKSY